MPSPERFLLPMFMFNLMKNFRFLSIKKVTHQKRMVLSQDPVRRRFIAGTKKQCLNVNV